MAESEGMCETQNTNTVLKTTISDRIYNFLIISFEYIFKFWFLVFFMIVWFLREPIKLADASNTGERKNKYVVYLVIMFLSTLTPKFYVALTATSSFLSGLILIFDWWYFCKYGSSFIEYFSVSYFGPFLGLIPNQQNTKQLIAECKVWRNPMSLLRGAEYQRLKWALNLQPLTEYDLLLSEKDHLSFFTCSTDKINGRPGDYKMLKAFKEKEKDKRISMAHEAISISQSKCATAFVLLAEEEATTIEEAESLFKQALKASENNLRQYNSLSADEEAEICHRRDTNVHVYVKRRLAMCARKLGRTKDAVKTMKDLLKEHPFLSVLNIHENLIEALLEMQAYSEVQQVLTKYDDISLPKSATICYTAALLKARAVADKFSPDVAAKRGLNPAEISAVEAIHRAVEFNPHVPKYLLEEKALILPPEHILKRGDSEAVAYAFFHLQYWKRIEGALTLLDCTWKGTFSLVPYPLEKGHLFHPYPSCTEAADRELMPDFHKVSLYPQRELPFFILFTAATCSISAVLALLTSQFPEFMICAVNMILSCCGLPFAFLFQKLQELIPMSIWQHFI
ncbi:suppressor of tumorigenicity 7 protein homolog isoform X3 [Hydra vulgaris]|uniref:Protein ST7 homolog n=1 Tax=Hydra vulgaris TaxID=6087 RepID=A0ABM4D8U5_HYDVU